MRRLLAAAEAEDSRLPLGGALWEELAASAGGELAAGMRLGAYRILRELGRGGMARVYLAERADDQFDQQVALKILERPADDAQAVARFHRERQILARLEHPNIARILDGGLAPNGRPYFVLELVDGLPIDRYCDQQGLDLPARLALFATVGRAVAAAHRQLVVHRDIKPSNILVSREGVPKLLDFGIARLVAGEGDEEAGLTRAWVRVLTPEYASPEQWAGEPVSTASDVYQLGLLLFELLVGERASRRSSSASTERGPAPEPRLPPKPSLAAAAASGSEAEARARRRGCDSARQLARRLAGDLDTLVEAALRPEAERRYESASRLVEDVERYLAGQPILARPDSLLYRGGKFLRRHRFAVAAAAAGVLALVALSAVYTVRLRHERNTAEQEAAKARQVSAFLTGLFEASDPYTQPRPGGPTALELLDAGSRRIEQDLEAQPEVRASLLHTLAFVYRRMVKLDLAEPLIAEAVALRRRTLGAQHPDTLDSLFEQAMLWRQRGRSKEALAQVQEVARTWEALYGPWYPKLGLAQVQLATLLDSGHGDLAEARRAGERGVAILARAEPPQPAELASAHHVLASILLDLGEREAGIEHQRLAVALYEDPIDPNHLKRGAALSDLALHFEAAGRLAEAASTCRQALALLESGAGAGHAQTAVVRVRAAHFELATGHPEAALAQLDRALTVLRETLGPRRLRVARAMAQRAETLLALGRLDEAGSEADAARALFVELGQGDSEDVWAVDRLRARRLVELGHLAEARSLLEPTAAAATRAGADSAELTAALRADLAELLLRQGELPAAEAAARQAVDAEQKLWTEGRAELVRSRYLLASILARRGESDAARAEAARSLALLGRVEGVAPTLERQVRNLARELGMPGPSP